MPLLLRLVRSSGHILGFRNSESAVLGPARSISTGPAHALLSRSSTPRTDGVAQAIARRRQRDVSVALDRLEL